MYHQTTIIGNLGRDPEMRYTQGGTAVCNFSVAVSERWTDQHTGERKEKATWYKVSVWGKQAESCNQYLSKGSQVFVSGTASVNAYTNNQGEPAASLELRAREVKFLDSSNNGGNGDDQPHDPNRRDMNDIPF